MKITTGLRIIIGVTLVTMVAYGTVALVNYNHMQMAIKEAAHADEIFNKIVELQTITTDYLLYRNERSRQQWLSTFDSLVQIISYESHGWQQYREQSDISRQLELVHNNFAKLIDMKIKGEINPQDHKANLALQGRLITQLLMVLQGIVTEVSHLNNKANAGMVKLQQITSFLILSSLVLLLVVVVVISWLALLTIIKPVKNLQAGVAIIGRGNLDYRIGIDSNNEIGELARGFDQMTADLQKITVSRNELVLEVEERQRIEAALKASEEQLRLAQESAHVGVWDWNPQTGEDSWTPELENIYGLTPGTIKTHHDWRQRVHPDDIVRVETEQDKALAKHLPIDLDFRILHSSGEIRWVNAKGSGFYNDAGEIMRVLGVNVDITERKRAEETIKASLQEKEVLLQEIYHRTKNNMNVICGLLKLQSAYTTDAKLLQIFQDTENRIRSMSLVHENIYQSKDLSNIDLKAYIQDLANSLLASYKVGSSKISLALDVDSVAVNIETAIPCGLLINELICNALKYAFPEEREGTISISLHQTTGGVIYLRVADDGVGPPPDFEIGKTTSLGLKLVTNLAEYQLHGNLEVDTKMGMDIRLRFQEVNYEE